MTGEENLSKLIKSMSPSLHDETFIFGYIPAKSAAQLQDAVNFLAGKTTQMLFWEDEGWSVILSEEDVEGLKITPVFRCKKITLNIHSSLDAVGFMAATTTRLTKLSIGVNPISGYFHDHLFVPVGKEEEVLRALEEMSKEQSQGQTTNS